MAQQQQTSRLHRLLTLLESGSTPAIRRTAARQIGDIAKLHSGELHPILKKVRKFLRSHAWETRVAAAQAVGAIAENVKHVTVKELLAMAEDELAKAGYPGVCRGTPETGLAKTKSSASLDFSSFDIQKVLDFGASLLASGGQEYDVVVDNSKTPTERLALQKKSLNKRLGLDVCERFMDINDIIVDEDLAVHKGASTGNGDVHSGKRVKQEVQSLVADMVPTNLSRTLSARERNQLKRKAKEVVRDGPNEWVEGHESHEQQSKRAKSVLTDQAQGDKVVVESVLDDDPTDPDGGGHWPFEYFVELLIHDMFDPIWEVRHGSMMALREVLSAQAGSAAVTAPQVNSRVGVPASQTEEQDLPSTVDRMNIDLNVHLLADDEMADVKDAKQEDIKSSKVEHSESSASLLVIPKLGVKEEENNCCTIPSSQFSPNGREVKRELDLNLEVKYEAAVKEQESISKDEETWSLVDRVLLDQIPRDSRALAVVSAAEQAWASNLEFLQDCSIRLLCIFALDRFGDFVSDQVVAPIRETCAQALGTVLKQMPCMLVHETLSVLLKMQGRSEWEVRHGSLLGIKYVVAVRQEMVAQLLPRVLPACMAGLQDRDDDVRAVAAEALTPAAGAIVSSARNLVSTILFSLWDILLELDDLSPSTSSAMHLLAELYSQPDVLQKTGPEARPVLDLNDDVQLEDAVIETRQEVSARNPNLLATLVPRLWSFMRHNISSVRHAAIRTLERLLAAAEDKGNLVESHDRCAWAVPILGDALRLVFQNLLLETDQEILQCSERVWRLLLKCPEQELSVAGTSYFTSWLKLASTPMNAPLDISHIFFPKNATQKPRVKIEGRSKGSKVGQGGFNDGMSKVILGTEGEKHVIHMRLATSSALGVLAASLPQSVLGTIVDAVAELLASDSSVQRQVASMVLVSWFKELKGMKGEDSLSGVEGSQKLRARILELLSCGDAAKPTPGSTLPYSELFRTYEKMKNEAGALLKNVEGVGTINRSLINSLPAVDTLTAEAAIDMVLKVESPRIKSPPEGQSTSTADILGFCRQRLLSTAGYLKCLQSNMHVSVLASLAGAIVWMGVLPVKLNPVIHPLMAAVKREQAELLQQPACVALAEVIFQCVGRKPSPNDKLIKNLCALACADTTETPQASQANADSLLYENGANQLGTSCNDEGSKIQTSSAAHEGAKLQGAITRHGAELALRALSIKFGETLFDKLPKLWGCITEELGHGDPSAIKGESSSEQYSQLTLKAEPQALVNNLQVVRSVCPALEQSLQVRLLSLLPAIFSCVHHSHAAVRLMAARCLTAMARTMTESVMAAVLLEAVPMLRDTFSVHARQGAGMLVTALVEGLGPELVPYAPYLIVPLLGCMSDSNEYVRQSVTHSFAALVPLLPLARGLPAPKGLNDSHRHEEDNRFLEQLLDNSQVDDYKLSIPLNVTLRRYQQEGINWLAFLKRFKLHGILCDDMGLGKTLQATAIVASDTAEQIAALAASKKVGGIVAPSLVVCPSTLVGHWAFEIEKFVEKSFLSPLQYCGSPQVRQQLRGQFRQHNLIITSYDVLRKDVDFLSRRVWNYCILDEGHIIKSSKSKITLAVKKIQAEHRLILSGTPIQNNVLELWSLFDFLMPGFLGSERQFFATYGKPLSAAKDAKAAGTDSEAGILAMEALHKQVMPFLLRRTKSEVLADLPPKIIQDRYCDMSPLQLRLYEDFSKSQSKKEAGTEADAYLHDASGGPTSPTNKPTHIFQALQYLKKLCSHPLMVLDECPSNYVASLQCATDPHDRSSLHELHHAPKLLALKEILEECGIGLPSAVEESPLVAEGSQHRVLIFAQLKAFLDIIERDLFQAHMKGVTYLRLDGSVEPEKRFEIVKAFNSDPTIDVLLLTTHVGGLGLNLTAADTVVFMEHDWNPMRDLQAMDRAHRLGQRNVVNVHRLIMRGTLEEKVMSLQQFKLSIFNNVITAENVSLSKMDTTRLLDLFTVSADSGKVKPAGRSAEAEAEAGEVPGAAGGSQGLKALMNGLDDLWDQSLYTEEYNLSQFLQRLNS